MPRFPSVAAVCLAFLVASSIGSLTCWAQDQPAESSSLAAKQTGTTEEVQQADQNQDAADQNVKVVKKMSDEVQLLRDFAQDQKAIWTSPTHVRLVDADWLVPLGATMGIMLATDTEYSRNLSNSSTRLKYSGDFSNAGIGAFAAVGAGFYFMGKITHDEHKRETGLLAGEAALDSLVPVYAFKYAFGRERPLQDNFQGNFFSGGGSFPSEHAALAWSIATVIAHEYPGPLTEMLAYGAASAIGFSRITAKQHFPTDVLVGSAIGWFVGQYVYRTHHDPDLGGDAFPTYAESQDRNDVPGGTPYVELDSWIYPAIDRLAALGYITSAYMATRPWTRAECAMLVQEAGSNMAADGSNRGAAHGLYVALQREFQKENDTAGGSDDLTLHLESLYAGVTGISGPPLTDSYHFGQTIINNYGRPYQQGLNSYDGFSAYATEGRFTLYVRGEYQHAPSAPAFSLPVRQFIATIDVNPLQPATPFAEVNQFRLLDTYVAARVENWNFAFGKQSLWWAPDYGSATLVSDNAEPMYMFRVSRIAPIKLPWIFNLLGPLKVEAFFGKLSGNDFPPRPLLHGEKISFKPTENLEIGFSRTAQLGGVGRALTPAAVINSYFSAKESNLFAANHDPGKRSGGFNLSYRLPHVRDWLSFYIDSMSPNDPSPFANPRRSVIDPGLYLTHFPKIDRLDFRIEAVSSDTPSASAAGGHLVYWDIFYHDLGTNKNNLIGSWIGRQGTGYQAWSTYWLGARNSIQFAYRNAKISKQFIPSGETVNDGAVKVDWWIRQAVNLSGSVQYEKWVAPILAPGPQTNWTTSFQVTFWPNAETRPTAWFKTHTSTDTGN